MEKSSFFNAELKGDIYDRVYLAEDYARYFNSFIANGVFPTPSTNLQVVANTNMTVTIKAGRGWISGYYYENTDDLIIPIVPADGVLNRIDRVVIRLDFLNREIKAYVKKGVFASVPVIPALVRDADMYELGIADIAVNRGAIKITQTDITDLRQNNNFCGLVVGVVKQIDTTNLFAQYQSSFEQWFKNVKDQLGESVAGNLQNQVTKNSSQLVEINKELPKKATKDGTLQTNLNSDMLNGKHASDFLSIAGIEKFYKIGDVRQSILPLSNNYLELKGQEVLKASYPTLYTTIGKQIEDLSIIPKNIIVTSYALSNTLKPVLFWVYDDVLITSLSNGIYGDNYSLDGGINWKSVDMVFANSEYCVALLYNKIVTKWICIGCNGAIKTSSNLTTWITNSFVISIGADRLNYLQDEGLSIGIRIGKTFTSINGTDWVTTGNNIPVGSYLSGLIKIKDKYYILNSDGFLYTSTNLTTWTKGIAVGSNVTKMIVDGDKKIVMLANVSYTSLGSLDGGLTTVGLPKSFTQGVFGNGIFLLLSNDGKIYSSKDLITFTNVLPDISDTLSTISHFGYYNSIFYIVGADSRSIAKIVKIKTTDLDKFKLPTVLNDNLSTYVKALEG